MISFLFWNIHDNKKAFPFIGRLAVTYRIDVFFLAECPKEMDEIPAILNQKGRGAYRIADRGITKVRGITRLPESDFFPHFTNRKGDMTIWSLAADDPGKVQMQVAVVHLLSKAGGATQADQQAAATEISREIAAYEDDEGCQDTLLVGDLNMNPWEPGMVLVSCFHASMTKRIADLPEREWRKEKYRRFYNPMWGLFGDRTPGPPGTHFWKSSVTSNHHWHMVDQVLLRPSLMHRLRNLQILDRDGDESLVGPTGAATKDYLSDHLPILFQMDT